MTKLSAIGVKQLKRTGKYSDGNGLVLKVQETKDPDNPNKSWLFRWGAGGKNTIGLGSLRDVTLAEARVLAAAHHRSVSAGEDPRAIREKQKIEAKKKSEALTFGHAAKQVIDLKKHTWTNRKSELEWTNTLKRFAFPEIESTLCSEVTVDQVKNILQPIWSTKHETAIKLRGRIEAVLDWAAAEENRSSDNPAMWKGRLKLLLPQISRSERIVHFASLPHQNVPSFITPIKNYPTLSAKALLFCILTATRTRETVEAKWKEFDLEKRLWIIPKERMKKKKEHRVPLSSQAIELLQSIAIQGTSPWVFNGRSRSKPVHDSEIKHKSLSNMAMLNFLQKTLNYKKLTVHGFRSTFRDWAGENPNVQYDENAIEHSLAHLSSDQTRKAYQRGDYMEKRKVLMQDWADYCFGVSTNAPAGAQT